MDDPLAILFVTPIFENETGKVWVSTDGTFTAEIKRHGRIEKYTMTHLHMQARAANQTLPNEARLLAQKLLSAADASK